MSPYATVGLWGLTSFPFSLAVPRRHDTLTLYEGKEMPIRFYVQRKAYFFPNKLVLFKTVGKEIKLYYLILHCLNADSFK